MRWKRWAIGLGALLASFVLVVLVEVQLARMGPRLDDQEGSRPEGLIVGDGKGGPIEIVWLGDSTTTGVGTDDVTEGMAHRTATAVSGELGRPVSLTVLGVSGAQVHEVLDDQLDALPATADVVVVSVGANDVTHLTRRPTFRSRYGELLDRVAELVPDADVVAVGVPDMGSVPRFLQPLRWIAGVRGDQLDDDVEAAAAQRDVAYVDLAGRTGGVFRSDPGAYFADDEFHPGPAGQEVWAAAVATELVTAARRSG